MEKHVQIIFKASSMPIICAHTHKHILSFLNGIHRPTLWHVDTIRRTFEASSIGWLSSYYYYHHHFFLSRMIHQSAFGLPKCKWQMKIVKRNQGFQEMNFKYDEKFQPNLHSTIIIIQKKRTKERREKEQKLHYISRFLFVYNIFGSTFHWSITLVAWKT